jgi:ribonuclease HI
MTTYTLRTDGGARGNPGPAAAAFVLESEDGAVVRSGGRFLGDATNNVAEYEALIWGLETALDHGVRRLKVCADSELVVRQVNGVYKVKHPNMKPLHAKVTALMRRFERVDVGHVRRSDNTLADALANEAMDTRSEVGDGLAPDGGLRQGALFE